jgi:hypothetical protein
MADVMPAADDGARPGQNAADAPVPNAVQPPPPADGAAAAPDNRRQAPGGGGGGVPRPVGVIDSLLNVRDRLFHTLFFRLTLAYALSVPRHVRRIIETMFLIKVLLDRLFC